MSNIDCERLKMSQELECVTGYTPRAADVYAAQIAEAKRVSEFHRDLDRKFVGGVLNALMSKKALPVWAILFMKTMSAFDIVGGGVHVGNAQESQYCSGELHLSSQLDPAAGGMRTYAECVDNGTIVDRVGCAPGYYIVNGVDGLACRPIDVDGDGVGDMP